MMCQDAVDKKRMRESAEQKGPERRAMEGRARKGGEIKRRRNNRNWERTKGFHKLCLAATGLQTWAGRAPSVGTANVGNQISQAPGKRQWIGEAFGGDLGPVPSPGTSIPSGSCCAEYVRVAAGRGCSWSG